MITRMLVIARDYVIWATATIAISTVFFSAYSVGISHQSSQLKIVAGLLSSVGALAITLAFTKELAHHSSFAATVLRRFTPRHLLWRSRSVSSVWLPYLDSPSQSVKARFISLAMSKKWYESWIGFDQEGLSSALTIRKDVLEHGEVIPFDKGVDFLISRIRPSEALLRSAGVDHIYIQVNKTFTLTIIIKVAIDSLAKEDERSVEVTRRAQGYFSEITGLRDEIETARLLPEPPVLLSGEEAVGIF